MDIPNVHFVWHTIAWRDKDWPAYNPLRWYPGDQYVDWVGISFFDSQRDEERNEAAVLARRLNKPLMIAESSPFNRYTEEEKLQWVKKLFEYIRKNNVTYLSYINVNWDELPMFKAYKYGDARLQKEAVVMKEWLRQIEQFRHR
jgi:beta-mannanase